VRITDDETVAGHEHWQLAQRVIESSAFGRADQLRRILAYLTRQAILHPNEPVREQDIAIEALGRRNDFDPGTDNIVRVQTSHLRKKLELYFSDPECLEDVRIEVPRGSYMVTFRASPKVQEEKFFAAVPSLEVSSNSNDSGDASSFELATQVLANHPSIHETLPDPVRSTIDRWRSWKILLITNALILLLLTGCVVYGLIFSKLPLLSLRGKNPLLRGLVENHKPVTLVLPDASLMIVQTYLNQNVNVSTYLSRFSSGQVDVGDPNVQKALEYVASKRTTTFGEASIAWSLMEELSALKADVSMRYSRDLHVKDLGEGNLVIIGSQRANPWASLFSGKTNFRFVENPKDHSFYFENVAPHPGESRQYMIDFAHHDRMVTYVDIALVPNLTDSGYALLINGADQAATEAAAKFILSANGNSDQLKTLFGKKMPQKYEIFLRGTHILGESEDSFEPIAIRSLD
jgi:hypothetical protein